MFSSSISDTDTALASQYNNLRLDIFDQTSGHDHAGTATSGKKVSHANLVDGLIPNTYLTHAQLTKHVQGAGTSETPDNPGGALGVHGLASDIYVPGSQGYMTTPTAFTAAQLVMQGGYVSWTYGGYGSCSVTFGDGGFSTLAAVVVTPIKAGPSDATTYSLPITAYSATGFTVKSTSYTPGGFYWIAIGTK